MSQQNLFPDLENEWQKEWKDMPEFNQQDLTSYRKLIIHFRNEEDIAIFSKLINQIITPKAKSIWFPAMDNRIASDKMYIDES
jgi:hypothetical protein